MNDIFEMTKVLKEWYKKRPIINMEDGRYN